MTNVAARTRRAFTMVEVAAVLVVLAVIAVAFVPVISGAQRAGAALPAWSSLSATLDEALTANARSGTAPAPPGCADVTAPAGGVGNTRAMSDPCTLHLSSVTVLPAQADPTGPGQVSVADVNGATLLVSSQTAGPDSLCQAVTYTLPAGPEVYWAFPATDGCSAQVAAPVAGPVTLCTTGGRTWSAPCTLPGPPASLIITRTNLVPNPSGRVLDNTLPGWQTDRYTPFQSYSTILTATDTPAPTGGFVRATFNGSRTDGEGVKGLGFHHLHNAEANNPAPARMLPVTPGQTLVASVYVRTSLAHTVAMRARFAAGSTWLAPATTTSTVALPAGQWVRLSITLTVPPGAQHMSLITRLMDNVPIVVGETMDGTGLLVETAEPGASPRTYFDGNTPGALWASAADASVSSRPDTRQPLP